jgi:hypothetical protein
MGGGPLNLNIINLNEMKLIILNKKKIITHQKKGWYLLQGNPLNPLEAHSQLEHPRTKNRKAVNNGKK